MPDKPLWVWEEGSKRYRDTRTGRFIGIEQMNSLRAVFVDLQKSRLAGLVNVYESGTIDIFTFRKQAADIIRQTYVDLYVIGAGGRKNMTQADWGKIGHMLRNQYEYLNRFMQQIANGELSNAQIAARLKMYINGANQALWKGYLRVLPIVLPAYPGDGSTACLTNCQCIWDVKEYKDHYDCFWLLGQAEHCPDCVERSKEWNPFLLFKTAERIDG